MSTSWCSFLCSFFCSSWRSSPSWYSCSSVMPPSFPYLISPESCFPLRAFPYLFPAAGGGGFC
ncbi:hypothetical protein ACFFX0_10745 [Citricoccus parietis]|uniref:Secreted protein n=1 Tax=Citricoccus parietis TaxID=592307 RepID=A0ABV5FY94_9MICC